MNFNKFVVLHPFFQIEGIDPTAISVGPYAITSDGDVIGQAPNSVRRSGYPSQKRDADSADLRIRLGVAMKERGTKISWNSVREACGFEDIGIIRCALHQIITEDEQDADFLSALHHLVDVCDQMQWIIPDSGYMPPLLERGLGELLLSSGYSSSVVSDRYGLEQCICSTSLLLAMEPLESYLQKQNFKHLRRQGDIARITNIDGSILLDCIEGQFYSVITSSFQREKLNQLFDGFFASEASWLNE